jgi:hypothetical protein
MRIGLIGTPSSQSRMSGITASRRGPFAPRTTMGTILRIRLRTKESNFCARLLNHGINHVTRPSASLCPAAGEKIGTGYPVRTARALGRSPRA